MKRLGKYTFADALDAKFNSKGIQFAAALSTLVVSMCYLIPQMVGAGVLVTPLLGIPHFWGVTLVGTIVIIIVATAGMASTTYVQFMKGGLLIVFSTTLVISVLSRGLSTNPDQGGNVPYHKFTTIPITTTADGSVSLSDKSYTLPANWQGTAYGKKGFIKLSKDGKTSVWSVDKEAGVLREAQVIEVMKDGTELYNGAPKSEGKFYAVGHISELKLNGKSVTKTGPVDPSEFLSVINNSTIVRWPSEKFSDGDTKVTVYYQKYVKGKDLLRPGIKFKVGGSLKENLNFISLMLALFLGTAALPHILIRYYTVPSPACARKSTIVAIAAISVFYVLTLYMGLGAMVNGVMDLTDGNMSAPLLAKSFGIFLFAIISALAFATVLGTVSGLIVASSGAVAHDIVERFLGIKMSDKWKVRAGKLAAVGIGIIAMVLGVRYKGMNVSYLVGWAFAVAASANLPAIVMLLFWKRTTAKGVTASVIVGMISSLAIILLSPEMYKELYALDPKTAPMPIDNPAIFSVPLSFLTLVVVSLFTQKSSVAAEVPAPVVRESIRVLDGELAPELMVSELEEMSKNELVGIILDLREEISSLRRELESSRS
jgi:cation/acetate symporter